MGKCEGSHPTEACKQCVASECTPALTTCSGLTSKGKTNFYTDMSGCGNNNHYDQGMSTGCMILAEHYSETCADCFGAAISCMGEKCLMKCEGSHPTEACKQCVASECTPA